ncbi:hypothetical protein FFF34_004435 [Inquilinus sp. KBS0705]|nr:hypothetical protein FFF34_004435 [Inquilinus sp. KBS0705]
MKSLRINILLLIFTVIAITSCSKDKSSNVITHSATEVVAKNFAESQQAWAAFKTTNSNTYTFILSGYSFTGNTSETKITVANGAIIKRDYLYYHKDGVSKITINEWHETTANLNSHPDDNAPFYTLDEVYTTAKSVWLKADAVTNDVYFEAKNNGIISVAGYTPKDCMDDCFVGVHITGVSK